MKPLPTNSPVRLDRFLSHSTGLSRSEVKKLLREGHVTIDELPACDPSLQVSAEQRIRFHGEPLGWPIPRYLMLHKPAGYVCAADDAFYPDITSLIDAPWAPGLHSAGRLDADSTGLVLLTNDGQWSHRITSPRHGCRKVYRVALKHPLEPSVAEHFARGLLLHGEKNPTLPAQLELLDSHHARVRVSEGKYHQVKRMFAACSNRVLSLHRECIGPIALDPTLQEGQWRELAPAEIASFVHDAMAGQDNV